MSLIKSSLFIKECEVSNLNNVFKNLSDNINLINRPETKATMLGENYLNKTEITKISRKLKSYRNMRLIYEELIPSCNGRGKIYFSFEKTYFIILTKKNVFYCDSFKQDGKYIILEKCFQLNGNQWLNIGNHKLEKRLIEKCI